jgi:6-phosphogluconolactonase
VAAYSIDSATGHLTFLNSVDALGDVPADMKVDHTGRTLVLGHFFSGNVVTFAIRSDGSLSEVVDNHRHEGKSEGHDPVGAHPHGVTFAPDGRLLYIADLGLDRIYIYRLNPDNSQLTPLSPAYIQVEIGKGPRHIAVHPNGKWLYVNNEQDPVESFFRSHNGMLEAFIDIGRFRRKQGVP